MKSEQFEKVKDLTEEGPSLGFAAPPVFVGPAGFVPTALQINTGNTGNTGMVLLEVLEEMLLDFS